MDLEEEDSGEGVDEQDSDFSSSEEEEGISDTVLSPSVFHGISSYGVFSVGSHRKPEPLIVLDFAVLKISQE